MPEIPKHLGYIQRLPDKGMKLSQLLKQTKEDEKSLVMEEQEKNLQKD